MPSSARRKNDKHARFWYLPGRSRVNTRHIYQRSLYGPVVYLGQFLIVSKPMR